MKEFFKYVPKHLESGMVEELTPFAQYFPMFLIIVSVMFIYFFRDKIRNYKYEKNIAIGLGWILFFNAIAYHVWNIGHKGFHISKNIPFSSTCGLMGLLVSIAMITQNKKLMRYLLVIPIIGGTMSIIFPDDLHVGFNHFRYYQFMIAHCFIVFLPFYMTLVYNVRLKIKDLLIAFGYHSIFLLTYAFINYCTGWNYALANPNYPPLGTPLETIAEFTNYSYVGYSLLSAPILLFVYFLFFSFHKLIVFKAQEYDLSNQHLTNEIEFSRLTS